ncbi:MAG: 5-dehydro-4-deoxy-D-glucuronate isomerase [Oligoflexales bacterium]
METRYSTDRIGYRAMSTSDLRSSFLLENLFKDGELQTVYCEVERAIIGAVVPKGDKIRLEAGRELAADYFCQRREVGVVNIGEKGTIIVSGTAYTMENLDCLYIGRGEKEVTFQSANPDKPAKFYISSYPAHTSYPTMHAPRSKAQPLVLGSLAESNSRTIYKYIHPEGIKSCQLMLGVTILNEGSIWNTMPAHTHERRTEVYMYFNMDENARVFHLLGTPDETRHLVMKNGEAVVSPSWSIHSGAGTKAYSFVWTMGGENQEFADMDHVKMETLK